MFLIAIYGPTKEGDEWRIQNNKELHDFYKDEDIITCIKLGQLRWAGHVIRMEEDRPVTRILISNPGGARKGESHWNTELEGCCLKPGNLG
jgi:hypothetical protein